MALSILDGNQSATTLSTILSSGQHITAHTVISLGTQAITDIVNATSANLTNTQLRASAVTVGGTVTVGNSLTISSLPPISGTVTANVQTQQSDDTDQNIKFFPIGYTVRQQGGALDHYEVASSSTPLPVYLSSAYALPAGTNRIGVVTIGAGTVTIGAGTAQIGSVTASISNFPATQPVSLTTLPALVAGTAQIGSVTASISGTVPISISSVTIGSLPAISGTVTAMAGTNFRTAIQDGILDYVSSENFPVNIGSPLPAGTNQIGSVTASISGTVPISISSVTVGNSVTIGSLPALAAGTNQIGSVTASISNTAITVYSAQGTAVTTSNFTSTTASTVLASFNATRQVLTIFNEGAGNLHICAGATCTTIAYQVRLSSGDYYEVPNHQTTITHSAVFATAGTARVTEVS